MTRHELKEQLQHDEFKDGVTSALDYVSSHRSQVTRWVIVGVAALIVAAAAIWFMLYRQSVRQHDLEVAMETLEASVGKPSEFTKTFPTQQAKDEASLKAFAEVAAKYSGSREGLIAEYYVGTIRAEKNDVKGAESNLNDVAKSSSKFAPLAKIALANLYANEGRISDAQALLNGLINKPTELVSKAQAQLLLAQIEVKSNPQEAKRILSSVKAAGSTDAAVGRAADQLSTQLSR